MSVELRKKDLSFLNLQDADIEKVGISIQSELQSRADPLYSLSLACNNLHSIPDILFCAESLVELHLYSNGLSSLPDGVSRLTRLQILDASNNLLSAFPPVAPSLQDLILHHNCISIVPVAVTKLTKLRCLDLLHNQLNVLPLELGLLSTISLLRLDAENMRFPPPEVAAEGARPILQFLRDQLTARH
jgi:Leucine-rich repeat (LRR) protein